MLKKEGLLERLKNTDDINKKQLEKKLEPIKNNINDANVNTFKKLRFLNRFSPEAKGVLGEIKRAG